MAYVDSASVPRRKRMKKMSSGDLLFAICAWTFLILFCLITLYPFFQKYFETGLKIHGLKK